MSTVPSCPSIEFPTWYDARCEVEASARGYVTDVIVRGENGAAYKVYFIDPVRLQQTLDDDAATGRTFFAEPGLIVLHEVTTNAIKQAVADLWREGFFQSLKPL